ncbi:RagB/SusD family nutrient uptake outer membrane protein [Chryseolinea sp. T2]|uniref:RagB/SusD family nutrient uptake outer membrane protein n=1 Tax=Chryseolinea sp. T2 TaxID=3129255 RepID=UPI0030778B5F
MKKIYISILCLALCFIHTRCENQLDLGPVGQLSEDSFYNNERDFEAGTYGVYSALLTLMWNDQWLNAEYRPDDDIIPPNNSADTNEDFDWTPTNDGNIAFLWNTCYMGISRANVVLDRLPDAADFADESQKPRFEGEAKFLRAYFHFLLAIHYGTPPVVDKVIAGPVDATKLPNSEPGQIWDLIISDLTDAQTMLPESQGDDLGRANSNTATALLGKVYLYRAQWDNNATYYQNAKTELTKLIGKYSLIENFGDNFSATAENNAESIFEVQFVWGTGDNTWLPTDFGLSEDQNVGSGASQRSVHFRPGCFNGVCAPGANDSGYGNTHITAPLQAEFEAGDPRRVESIYLNGDEYVHSGGETPFNSAWSVSGSTPAKYIKHDDPSIPAGRPNATLNNERVIRYADVLLMLAETKLLGDNDVSGAAELINEIRHRADPTDAILAPRPAGATKEQMWSFLMHERRVELAVEGHRYHDLVRWHRAGLINIKTDINFGRGPANANWSEKNLLRPIPQAELDVNGNLRQNDPYVGG